MRERFIQITQEKARKLETGMKKRGNKHKTNKIVALNTKILIITTDVNDLNILIKRQRLTEWIENQHQQKNQLYDV